MKAKVISIIGPRRQTEESKMDGDQWAAALGNLLFLLHNVYDEAGTYAKKIRCGPHVGLDVRIDEIVIQRQIRDLAAKRFIWEIIKIDRENSPTSFAIVTKIAVNCLNCIK